METLFNSPDKWESKYITADGYNTHYIEAGKNNPEPLILVHGGANEIGMGNYRWYPNIIPLGEHFHVHAVDELGHGYTDPPRNLEDLGHVRVRAEHVISFIEALDVGPVNLAGQSQGGWIVAYITIKRPELVKKLVLIDSGSTSGSAIKREGQENQAQYIDVDGKQIKVDGSGDLPYFKEVFAQDKKFVFHCASGWRSAISVATLQDMGFDAAHLKDGFGGWEKAGGPIERS